jgi:hypothetical protein
LEQQERLRHRDQEHHLTLLPPHLQQQLPSHLQQQPQQMLLQEDAQRQPPKELRYPVPRELQFRKMEDTGCWMMWQKAETQIYLFSSRHNKSGSSLLFCKKKCTFSQNYNITTK